MPAETTPIVKPPSFRVSDALVEQEPNVALHRFTACTPTCLLGVEQFLAVHRLLPPCSQGRKWQLVYSSDDHGFGFSALQRCCQPSPSNHYIKDGVCVLVVHAAGETLVGAILSNLPILDTSNRKRYFGTASTSVFRFITVDGNNKDDVVRQEKTRVQHYPSASPKVNDYYISAANERVSVGGGGAGPALQLTDDMSYVASSSQCDTFGPSFRSLLDKTCAGVEVEGGECRATNIKIELWKISEFAVSIS